MRGGNVGGEDETFPTLPSLYHGYSRLIKSSLALSVLSVRVELGTRLGGIKEGGEPLGVMLISASMEGFLLGNYRQC